jgi:hypothetical protein
MREKHPRATEKDISQMAEGYRLGNVQMEKQVWRRVLNRLYKGEEERLAIEVRVIEAIKVTGYISVGEEQAERGPRYMSPPQNTLARKRSRSNSSQGRNNLVPLRSKDVNRPEIINYQPIHNQEKYPLKLFY